MLPPSDGVTPLNPSSGLLAQYISRQEDIEESLRQKETELRLITAMTSTMLCHCAADHTFKFVNEAYAKNLGLPPQEIVGKPIRQIIGEEGYAAVLPHIERVLRKERVVFEVEVLYPQGTHKKVLHVIYNPVINSSGETTGWVASLNDITEHRKSDNVMRHLANIVESSDDAIVSKNLDSIITSWNQGAENIFGYKAEEVIGKSILILIPPELHKEEPQILLKLQRGERIEHFQTVRRRKDGRLIHVSLTVSPIFNAQGKVVGASKIARDISEQKKTQESLARLNQELKDLTANLERRVEERTARLQEQSEQLRQLAFQLTKAEETERKRLAQILHDHLQQLLVAAKMRIDLLLRRQTNPSDSNALKELHRYIDEAFNSSRSLTAELRPPVLYEGGLLPALRFLARKFHDQYEFEIKLSIAPDAEPSSSFLKAMIYSSIQEIIFNAVKYSGVHQCVLQMQRLAESNSLQITIKDEGVGFDTAKIGRKGSEGFGLFSIRERIKALGGDFRIESFLGNGTTFEITVPDQRERLPRDEQELAAADPHLPQQHENGLSILLVDDHKILRQSLANLLRSQPFISEVLEAEDGQDAVDKAAHHPDVIIMDLNIPKLTGMEATKIIRGRFPDIQIIGLSVQTEPETIQAMKDSGAVAYFHKGENTDVLIEILSDFSKSLRPIPPSSNLPSSL